MQASKFHLKTMDDGLQVKLTSLLTYGSTMVHGTMVHGRAGGWGIGRERKRPWMDQTSEMNLQSHL